uniref:NADH-ubiquinone oxidoreductase chain 6 n=1 Tax=Ophiosteira antarctica TaxID=2053238 RepID=A0A3G2WKQ9_9ECHI|nr:NADH dehydrogenase subunit 6 [Ophiosteira antarctica]AYO99672.1 NADH dehydrogenase subunit 6 [Ophiosteira antarctica]
MLNFIIGIILFGGLVLMFSGSPYYGLLGVLIQSGGFSLYLFLWGLPFFSLLLILIYIGGMLIVFLFSTILSAERYPGSSWVEVLVFLWGSLIILIPINFDWHFGDLNYSMCSLSSELGFLGVFGDLWLVTCLIALILLVTLVVVLIIAFEHSKISLRSLLVQLCIHL